MFRLDHQQWITILNSTRLFSLFSLLFSKKYGNKIPNQFLKKWRQFDGLRSCSEKKKYYELWKFHQEFLYCELSNLDICSSYCVSYPICRGYTSMEILHLTTVTSCQVLHFLRIYSANTDKSKPAKSWRSASWDSLNEIWHFNVYNMFLYVHFIVFCYNFKHAGK